MKLTRQEQETIIVFNEEETDASVETCNGKMKRRLDGLCEQHPDTFKFVREDEYAKRYIIPKNRISIIAPREKRNLTEKEKELLRERLNKMRKTQN